MQRNQFTSAWTGTFSADGRGPAPKVDHANPMRLSFEKKKKKGPWTFRGAQIKHLRPECGWGRGGVGWACVELARGRRWRCCRMKPRLVKICCRGSKPIGFNSGAHRCRRRRRCGLGGPQRNPHPARSHPRRHRSRCCVDCRGVPGQHFYCPHRLYGIVEHNTRSTGGLESRPRRLAQLEPRSELPIRQIAVNMHA